MIQFGLEVVEGLVGVGVLVAELAQLARPLDAVIRPAARAGKRLAEARIGQVHVQGDHAVAAAYRADRASLSVDGGAGRLGFSFR